jgi:hypothetical protein
MLNDQGKCHYGKSTANDLAVKKEVLHEQTSTTVAFGNVPPRDHAAMITVRGSSVCAVGGLDLSNAKPIMVTLLSSRAQEIPRHIRCNPLTAREKARR